MATIIRDGFDFYSTASDLSQNYWSVVDSTGLGEVTLTTAAQTRFGVGRAIEESGANDLIVLQQAIGSNEQTLFFAGAVFNVNTFSGTTTSGMSLRFIDNATVQCSVLFANDGAIRVYRGDPLSGTLLATFASAFSAQAWNQWNVKVVVDGTNGEVHVRKNGAQVDTFAVTGLDLTSTANNFATKVEVHSRSTNFRMDDVWWYTGSGAAPNDFIGDVRAMQVMPSGDVATQFAQGSAVIPQGNSTANTTRAYGSNSQQSAVQFTGRDGTVSTVTVSMSAGFTGNAAVAIYRGDGPSGAPQTLLASSNTVVNPVAGPNVFTFASPPTLSAGVSYWLAWLADAAGTTVAKSGSQVHYSNARTFGLGFFSPWIASVTSALDSTILANISPTGNFSFEQELSEDGNLSFVYSSTPSNVDLYGSQGLLSTPLAIVGLSVRGFQAKNDAGKRGGAVRLRSSGTDADGPTVNLSNTYQNVYLIQDTDPNTGVPWTVTGVLNAQFGPKVAT